MPCGEALRGHIRLDLPRHRIRRRHILHSELQRAYQFGPGIAEATHLSGHHIVEHAGTCAVAGQSGAEHRGARTPAVTIAVHASIPRWLKHGSTIGQGDGNMR